MKKGKSSKLSEELVEVTFKLRLVAKSKVDERLSVRFPHLVKGGAPIYDSTATFEGKCSVVHVRW